MIYITSFVRSKKLPKSIPCWSAAVYQPEGFGYPKAQWCDIRMEDGRWIRPREFLDQPDPLQAYRRALWMHYTHRAKQVESWLSAERDYQPIALCCWCPYDKAAQRQLQEFGSFVCHTAVIGEYLTTLGEQVWYDGDRRQMAVLTQK